MTGIERDGKVRKTAQLVNDINWLVGRLEYVAGLRHQIATCRKADHANLLGIKVQFLRFGPNQPDSSLRVLKRAGNPRRNVAIAILVPVVIALRNAVLQQYAGDPA